MVVTRSKRKLEDFEPTGLTTEPSTLLHSHTIKSKSKSLPPPATRRRTYPQSSTSDTNLQFSRKTSITRPTPIPIPSGASYSSSHIHDVRSPRSTHSARDLPTTSDPSSIIKALRARNAQQARMIKRMSIDSAVVVLISRSGPAFETEDMIALMKAALAVRPDSVERSVAEADRLLIQEYSEYPDLCARYLARIEMDYSRAARKMAEALLDVLTARAG